MKKIRKSLSNLFKYIIRKIFILFNGKIVTLDNKSNFLSIGIKKKKNNFFFYEINNGKVFTDNVQNVAVLKNNYLIKDASYQQHLGHYLSSKKNFVIKNGTPKFLKHYNGNTLSLVQGASGENYFHWLFDILPKLKIASENISLKNIDYYYLPEIKYNFQKQTLNKFEILETQIINSNQRRYIKSKILMIPEHPWFTSGYLKEKYNKMPRWIIQWLRDKFIKKDKDNNKNKLNKYDYIFIDRKDSSFNRSHILNTPELFNALKKYNFKKLILSDKKFDEQVEIFNDCKIVIGAIGAGLANTVFCKKGTMIIELCPKKHEDAKVYGRIASVNKLNYYKIVVKHDKYTNFFAPISDILSILKKTTK
jgi:capsular polysaccharide biosynthesis protein